RSTTSRPRSSGLGHPRARGGHGQLAAQAAAHEFLAVVALHLLVGRLLVAVLHAVLLLLLRRARAVVLQAVAHEALALVALHLLGRRLLVAVLHALLLLLLRRARRLLLGFLFLREGGQDDEREGNGCDQGFQGFSFKSFSMAVTSVALSGSTALPKLCTRLPLRSMRYLWKFHRGAWPLALVRSPNSELLFREVFENMGKSMAY